MQVVLVLGSAGLVLSSPVQVNLKSQLPASPIEDPDTWAWGLHPDNGLDYKARDSLSVEVCLANPELIDTAKCSLPRDLCLSNAEFTPLVGCSGQSRYCRNSQYQQDAVFYAPLRLLYVFY